jgi:GNAT superfamily N-acetyltransferase
MNDCVFGKFEIGEETAISHLIKTVFDEFAAPDYSPAGNTFFHAYIEPDRLLERFSNGDVLLTAKTNNRIIGMIEVSDQNHICLLFVDKAWHGKGIAKRLVARAIATSREKDTELKYFEVNSSPYAERIYARMGFTKTADIQDVNGLKFIPMKMELP